MKKIVATLLLAGLIASAVMADTKPTTGKSVHAAASTTAKKHKKHRKARKHGVKGTSAKSGK